MATRKKKHNSSGGILGTILILCIVTVCAVAVGKSMLGAPQETPDTSNGVQASQTDTDSDPTSESVSTSSATDSASAGQTSSAGTTDTATEESSSASTDTESSDPSDKSDFVSSNKTDSFDKDAWYMLLANPDHPVPDGYTFEQATIYSAGRNWVMDARCAEEMKAMIAAAKEDGVDLILCSTYRTIETQTKNFNNKVKEYMNKGYSEEDAKKVTATIIAVPGTSEHHTGMAADIVTPSYQRLNAGFDQTDAYKWLEAHCAEYGYVLRYRKDKTEITKIIYEPWHYRYVGKEAATIMMNEKLSFEEFLEKYGT